MAEPNEKTVTPVTVTLVQRNYIRSVKIHSPTTTRPQIITMATSCIREYKCQSYSEEVQNYDLNFRKSSIENRNTNLFHYLFCVLRFDIVAIRAVSDCNKLQNC